VSESFFATLKREFVANQRFGGLADTKRAIAAWVHCYNTVRLHSTIGHLPPSSTSFALLGRAWQPRNYRLSSKWRKGHPVARLRLGAFSSRRGW